MESSSAYLSRSLLAATVGMLSIALSSGAASAQELDDSDLTPGLDSKQQRPATETALFRAFAQIKGLSAVYTEEKFLSLLAVPLKSNGQLHFMKPGYLSRIVVAPEKSRLTISDAELRIVGKDGEEVIDLRQSDRVRLFVTSLVQVFQGNQKALKKHYRVLYTPKIDDPHAWQLELHPLKKPLTQIMKRLVLAGRDKTVTRIELHEPNGDRTITKIAKVNPKRNFSKAEKKEIFGVITKPHPDADTSDRSKRVKAGKSK